MKMKLLGVVVAIMLLMTVLVIAKPYTTQSRENSLKTRSASVLSADVPVWNLGDTWTYKIDNISINYNQENQSVDLFLGVAELPLVVVDATGDNYRLSFETAMNGHGNVNTNQGSGPVEIALSFDSITVAGEVIIEKSTLGLKEISVSFDTQKFSFDILDQPYLDLPAWLQHISTKITMNLTTHCNTAVTMLTFPLNIGTIWNSTSTSFSMNGKIQCIWFNILYFVNNIAKLLNKEFLPPEIAALLPVIDIKDTLSTLGPGNVFQIPEIPYAFYCLNTENITVQAGSYEAFDITLLSDIAHCYYAPAAGNVIKISGDFEGILPNVKHISMELLSTTYS